MNSKASAAELNHMNTLGKNSGVPNALKNSTIDMAEIKPLSKNDCSDEEIILLADAFMVGGNKRPWIQDWVSNQIDMAADMGRHIDEYIASDELITKLVNLNDAELTVLEEKVEIFLRN